MKSNETNETKPAREKDPRPTNETEAELEATELERIAGGLNFTERPAAGDGSVQPKWTSPSIGATKGLPDLGSKVGIGKV